jgi:predicted dehydrogenase
MHKVKVGYIGWLAYDATEFSQPYAICDVNVEKLQKFAAEHPGVKVYTDYRAMAEDPALDVVIISTPNWLHCEMSCLFLAKGKHVFCEKPMGVNRREMNRMLVAQRRSGRQLAIDFEMRASGATQHVKNLLDSKELGELRGIEFVHHRGAWLAEGSMLWRVDPAKSGGLFFMEPCHEVDFIRWLSGEITHVQSFKIPNTLVQYPENMPDNVCSHLFFANGMQATISTSFSLSHWDAKLEEYDEKGHDMFFVFTGTKGACRLNCINNQLLVVKYAPYPPGVKGVKPTFDRLERFPDSKSFHDIEANRLAFIRSCAEGKPHLQDAYDAWRTHCVCLAAEKSALCGFRRLKVDYTDPGE